MFKKKEKVSENYMDYIPKRSESIKWKQKEDSNLVQIIVKRDSITEKITQKLFFTPDKSKIDLDELGTFVWLNINGENTVYEIGQLIKENFKGNAEPLYERLIQFLQILSNNKFISFK